MAHSSTKLKLHIIENQHNGPISLWKERIGNGD